MSSKATTVRNLPMLVQAHAQKADNFSVDIRFVYSRREKCVAMSAPSGRLASQAAGKGKGTTCINIPTQLMSLSEDLVKASLNKDHTHECSTDQ
eukprot:5989920-Amphidinium_carterae.1